MRHFDKTHEPYCSDHICGIYAKYHKSTALATQITFDNFGIDVIEFPVTPKLWQFGAINRH